jgi:hypothetical protein
VFDIHPPVQSSKILFLLDSFESHKLKIT